MSPFGRGSCNARGCGVGAKTSKGLSGVAGGLAVGGRASGGAGVMEIGVSAADGSFNSPDDDIAGDDVGANPRPAASASTTGVGAVAAEGGSDGVAE
jgi:hypothetical protein